MVNLVGIKVRCSILANEIVDVGKGFWNHKIHTINQVLKHSSKYVWPMYGLPSSK
jgi:hypothetical protein